MKYLALTPLLFLLGCAEPAPVVSDFNGDSVRIQQSTIINIPDPERADIVAEANEICATKGRKAQYASTRSAPNAAYAEHLFLCL